MFTRFTQNYDAILIISYLAIITLIYSSCACAWSKLKNISNPDVYLPWSIKSIECIQPYSTSQPRSQIQTLLFCDSVHGFSLWSFSNVELTRTFPLASQLIWTLFYSVHKIDNPVIVFLCTLNAIWYNWMYSQFTIIFTVICCVITDILPHSLRLECHNSEFTN